MRQIKKDFDAVVGFINDFKAADLLSDEGFVRNLSYFHKKYFSYLVFVAEIEQYSANVMEIEGLGYLKESVSDCGQAFFLLMTGCYKGARLLLRSSIECFCKGICKDEIADIDEEKSVYEIFNKVTTHSLFLFCDTKGFNMYDTIHNVYKTFCADVHTADEANMANIESLKYFPAYSPKESESTSKNAVMIMSAYVTLLALKHNKLFHSIQHENKEIIQASFLNECKKAINNIE